MGRLAPEVTVTEKNTDDGATDKPAAVVASRQDWMDAGEPLTKIVKAYIDHPGIGTLLLGAFLVLKGYVLAKGDIPIALGILRNAGLPTVVVGGLLSGLPILVAAMLAATIFNVLEHRPGEKKKALANLPLSPVTVVLLATIVLSLVVTPWPFMATAGVVGLLAAGSYRLSKSHHGCFRALGVLRTPDIANVTSGSERFLTWPLARFARDSAASGSEKLMQDNYVKLLDL